VFELRSLGLLRRAVLVTAAWPGNDLDRLVTELQPAELADLLRTLCDTVDAWHRAGFRDGNLDLRNLLATRTSAGWLITKIDSPRFRVARPGLHDDRAARADRRRLAASLARHGLRLPDQKSRIDTDSR
jgi:hypothetical protein